MGGSKLTDRRSSSKELNSRCRGGMEKAEGRRLRKLVSKELQQRVGTCETWEGWGLTPSAFYKWGN